MKKVLIAIFWISCSFFNYGFMLGSFTHEFPDQSNIEPAIFGVVVGPLGVPATLVVCAPFHWRLKPMTREEQWQAFHRKYPVLDREYFEATR